MRSEALIIKVSREIWKYERDGRKIWTKQTYRQTYSVL